MKRLMTCIECPEGCSIEVETDGSRVVGLSGHKCTRGALYARQEIEAPMRTFTTSVLTRGLELKMLPVRSSKPIPKGKLLEAMEAVKRLTITSAVKTGAVIAPDFLGLGADLVACRGLEKL